MRRLLYLALFLALPAMAQTNIPTFQYVNSAPVGVCSGTPPIQVVYSTGAMWACLSGTWGQINGGGGTGALFPGTNGLVKNTSTTASVTATGTRDGTGDYQLPTIIQGAGGGLSCALTGNTWTCTLSGGAGSGSVNTGAANQMGEYPAAGTTIGPSPNIYAVNPAQNSTQISALFNSLSGSNTVIIPAGTPQVLYAVNGQVPYDLRLGANYFQMPGVACDGMQSALGIQITSGSNTSTVGSLLSAADVGKTFFFFNKSGFAYGFTQSVWTAKLTSYTFPTATWSANAPFTNAGQQVWYGTDNLATVNTAMTQASSAFPLTIPTGCTILVSGTIPWNNNQTIVGRRPGAGGFTAPPGKDVIATTDTSGQSISAAGTGIKGISIFPGTEVDSTYPINYYAADGTLTVQAAMYRPGGPNNSSLAAHPLAPGWLTGGKNGVASITQNSAVICTPNAYAPPVVGQQIMFPYFTNIFTSTVLSTAGSCAGGFTARTMAAAFPNTSTYTVAQAEWFTGSAIQSTTTAIPTTITYPLTLTLTLSTNPVPGWPSNFPQTGHIKICGIEADYGGDSGTTMTLRRGPASSAGCGGTTVMAPMNPCPAKNLFASSSDQPWPVTPTINSGDSTPSGAAFFPGECVGNAGIAMPTANGNVYAGTGLSGGFIEDVNFTGTAGNASANANNVAGWYVAGNNAPFGSHFSNLIGSNLQYDIVQGPASSGQHGVTLAGPTGFGNSYHNLWFFGADPLAFVDMQGSKLDEINMNTSEISPFDGTTVGAATCLQMGLTLDEQTGSFSTLTAFDQFDVYACEPEGGSHAWVKSSADIQGGNISFKTANFEGVPSIFGGDHFKCENCSIAQPFINYGTANDFGTISGTVGSYITNVWDGRQQFFDWGANTKCSMFAGGAGPSVACGAGTVQGYEGRDIAPSVTGSKPYFANGGMITPWQWNTNNGFDTTPMTTTGTPDPTASYWGASATCNLGGAALCQSAHWNGFNGFKYIGPFNDLYDGPYLLDATFKTLSSTSSFTLTLTAQDSGTGQCSAPGNVFSGTVNTTTSFSPFKAAIDLTGKAGCVFRVQYSNGSTTDTVVIDRFNLVAVPQQQLIRVATLTLGVACGQGVTNGTMMASDANYVYWCANGVVQGLPFGGSLGISTLTGDVNASGTGSVAATVVRIGGGTIFSTFTGLLQNTAGVVGQANSFNLPGFGQVGTRFTSGVNTVTFSATPVFDLSLGDTQRITLTGDVTSSTFSNPPPTNYKQRVDFLVCQDGAGNHKFNYPTSFQGITPVTMTASACTSEFFNATTTGAGTTVIADNYNSENCISSASPAVCDQATIGEVAIPSGTNPTLQINTTAWTAHSQLIFAPDQTKAADLSLTCNTSGAAGHYEVTGGSAGVNVIITWYGTISTNPLCGTYTIRNP